MTNIGGRNTSGILERLAEEFASVIPKIDSQAEHSRWKPGIGPFEEERQLEKLVEATAQGSIGQYLQSEQPYPHRSRQCDLIINTDTTQIPVEAKLLRFRYDNGSIDPNSYARVFTPFPERTSSSLLTDVVKLHESAFDPSGGLLGLYYEKQDETYKQMDVEKLAEKLSIDVRFWYDFEVKTVKIARFDGLRHPHHQRGAIIAWEIMMR